MGIKNDITEDKQLRELFSIRSRESLRILGTDGKQIEEKNCNKLNECMICDKLSSVYYAVVSILVLAGKCDDMGNIPKSIMKDSIHAYICDKCAEISYINKPFILIDSDYNRYTPDLPAIPLVPNNNDWKVSKFKKLPKRDDRNKGKMKRLFNPIRKKGVNGNTHHGWLFD